MKPAFRAFDPSQCIADAAEGPALTASSNVRVNSVGAVRLRDTGWYPSSCSASSTPWRAQEAAASVRVNGRELVRTDLFTAHPHGGGVTMRGSPNVNVGGPKVDIFERSRADAIAMFDAAEAAMLRWNAADKAHFKQWFGDDSEASRQEMLTKIRRSREMARKNAIVSAEGSSYASVRSSDADAPMKMKDAFWGTEREGHDTQGGVIVHESSHYDEGAGTDDHEYGPTKSQQLAKEHPDKARSNADNIEYYCEGL